MWLCAVAAALLSGCLSTVSGNAVREQHTGGTDVPLLGMSKLDGVMLSVGALNGIVGSTQMKVAIELQQMNDHSAAVSDPDCVGSIYGAEAPVYAGTGWTAMRDQVAQEPNDDNQHWVEQTAVLYPSADKAQRFFEDSKSSWRKCGGYSISVEDGQGSYLWAIDEIKTRNNMVTQMSAQQDAGGWECQHALSVVSNLSVEAWACGYKIRDEAAEIATEMIANASK
jgi:hypothetical protein